MVDFLNQGENLYDLDKYDMLTADLLNRSGTSKYIKVDKNEKIEKEMSQLIDGVFASEGVTVDFGLLDRSNNKDALLNVVGSTYENTDKSFVRAFDTLKNEQFDNKNLRNTKRPEYTAEEFEERDNLKTEVGKLFMTFFTSDNTGFKLSLKKLDPTKNKELLSPSEIERIANLPMPILSLIFSRSGIVRKNWHDLDIDVLQDGSYSEFYRYNFDLMVKVQYLNGYELGDLESQLKSPNWTDLTTAEYRRLSNLGRPVLCRLQPHQDDKFGIGQTKNLDISIYNRYFLLVPSSANTPTTVEETDVAQRIISRANSFMSNMTPTLVDYVRTTAINHSDMFGRM